MNTDPLPEDTPCHATEDVTVSLPGLIATIRSAFSVQTQELAEIVGVERTDVYSWIRETAAPTEASRLRLQHVYRLALRWETQCSLPARELIRTPAADGLSLLDRLRQDPLDEEAIQPHLDALAAERCRLEKEREERTPSARELARRHGLDISRIREQRDVLDVITGKRFSADD